MHDMSHTLQHPLPGRACMHGVEGVGVACVQKTKKRHAILAIVKAKAWEEEHERVL